MKSALKKVSLILAICFVAFHLYTAAFGTMPGIAQKSIHLGFLLVIFYINAMVDSEKRWEQIFLGIMALFALGGCAYITILDENLQLRAGIVYASDILFAILLIIAIFEACRRKMGNPLVIITLVFVAYAFLGKYIPGFLNQPGMTLKKFTSLVYLTTDGIFGSPLYASASYVVLFVLLGAIMSVSGIGDYMTNLATSLFGHMRGGPAKVAVVASGFFGSISGSPTANVIGTGTFTIPMMKKTGYRPEFAGAVEAASSTGGQIMPPIMGAAAFLMAEYMGIPYIQVATIAIIPAVLYFTGIFWTVHLEAKKRGLKGIPIKDLPSWIYLLKNCYLIIPLVLLVWIVSAGIYTMAMSAAISILAALVIGFIHFFLTNWQERTEEDTFGSVLLETSRAALLSMLDAFAAGARNSIAVGVACALAGLIAGCITFTGLASTIINVIVLAAGDYLIIGLILTMLCCIVLGMGVPTTANYCIMAATCAPILIQLGVPLVCAHFFVFYFGILADITPPVALAAYAGSAIAKSRPMRTAFNATRLGIAAYIIPFIFAFFPAMIMQGEVEIPIWLAILNTVMAGCGLYSIAAGLQGYLFQKINPVFRVISVIAGVVIMIPIGSVTEMYTIVINLVGFAIIAAITFIQRALGKRNGGGSDDNDQNSDSAQTPSTQAA